MINLDCAENYGNYKPFKDEDVIPCIEMANIACGAHAGDPVHILHTIDLCVKHSVKIGAHPGYMDLMGFGRRSIPMSNEELKAMILYQVSAVKGMTESRGSTLYHVKPHGALYHDLAQHSEKALSFVKIIKSINPKLKIVTQQDSALHLACKQHQVPVMLEGFADRRYRSDGRLIPRDEPRALILDPREIILQYESLLSGVVTTTSGYVLPVLLDTICFHNDHGPSSEALLAIRQQSSGSAI